MDRISHQARPLDVLITAHHELRIRKTVEMVDKISNTQLTELNSKPHGGKSLINLIDSDIGDHLYTHPGSVHYEFIFLDQFHGTFHIHFDQKKKSEIKLMKISNAKNCTTKACVAHI